MDVISHGLYGGIILGRKNKKNFWISLLFGMAPDLIAFGPFFILNFFKFETWFKNGRPEVPQIIHNIYNFTHSFIIYSIIFIILYFFVSKHIAKLSLAWPLHILIDIPTHSKAFFPTPFLYPVSNFSVDGIPWGEPIIFLPNVIILVTLYTLWYLKKKKIERMKKYE